MAAGSKERISLFFLASGRSTPSSAHGLITLSFHHHITIPNSDPLFLSLWRRKWQHTPILLPAESHGGRTLVGYSPWGRKESDTTERLHFHFHFHFFAPLSCEDACGNRDPPVYSRIISCLKIFNLILSAKSLCIHGHLRGHY